MRKNEDNPDMRVLKTSTCKTISGKSNIKYCLGCLPDGSVHLRIAENDGGGFFSDEWIALDDILRVLKDRPKESPVLSHFLTPLLKGKSVNTSAFILAALTHLKLMQPLPKKKRVHELLDPRPFLDQVNRLMSTGGTTRKTPTKKTTTRKAAVKKTGGTRATTRRKSSSA